MKSYTRLMLVILMCILMPRPGLSADLSLPKGIIPLKSHLAPALVLRDMDENLYDLAKTHGKWRFVHFWASWCTPCRKEMPSIQVLARQFEDKPIDIILINTAEDADTVFSFMAIVAPDMNSLMDLDGQVAEVWKPRGLPSTYLVDPDGNIRYLVLGGRPWDTAPYSRFLNNLLEK